MPHHQHHLPPCHSRCKHIHTDRSPSYFAPYPSDDDGYADHPPCWPPFDPHGNPHGHAPYHRPCRWCRLWLYWLPYFATEPFFTDIAKRYARVHQHFNRTRRRHPLRVAAEIRDIEDYLIALRSLEPLRGRGALGRLIRDLEGLAGRLEG